MEADDENGDTDDVACAGNSLLAHSVPVKREVDTGTVVKPVSSDAKKSSCCRT